MRNPNVHIAARRVSREAVTQLFKREEALTATALSAHLGWDVGEVRRYARLNGLRRVGATYLFREKDAAAMVKNPASVRPINPEKHFGRERNLGLACVTEATRMLRHRGIAAEERNVRFYAHNTGLLKLGSTFAFTRAEFYRLARDLKDGQQLPTGPVDA
jgi:hypothetical protein